MHGQDSGVKEFRVVLQELWREAISDSGLDASKLQHFDAVRVVRGGAGAQWWAPGTSVLEPPVELELAVEDAASADAPPLFEKHRVATAPIGGLEPPAMEAVLAAKLRHELEHACQWDVWGREPFDLMKLVLEVHRRKMGGTIYGTFRNQMPIEDDANAAASVFVRRVRPDSVEDLKYHDAYGPLFRSVVKPPNPQTLVSRMIGFLFQHRDEVQALAADAGVPEADYIGFFSNSGAQVWLALCDAADAV
jgi:hypothetical protein